MIQLYVSARDTDGNQVVGDHYEFLSVPRVGERVILDNRGGMTSDDSRTPLRVVEVINYAEPKGDVMSPVSYIQLSCEVIG